MNEYGSILCIISLNFSGKSEARILEPSSGGIGIRLKIARYKLTKTIYAASIPEEDAAFGSILMYSEKTRAKRIFADGPASATIISPHRLFLRLYGL